MDESVIFIDDSNEIIDLSETIISEDVPRRNLRSNNREQNKKSKQKPNEQPTTIIDLSIESGGGPQEENRMSLESEDTHMCCPICFQKFRNVSVKTTLCGHVFCSACIDYIITTKKSCPICRKKLTMKSLILLHL